MYGGFDLGGRLGFQRSLFGTPVVEHRIPPGTLHRERPPAMGHAGQ
ncbi:hypothetical protein [Streptomyces sp. NBC_00083]|nr:hypothetical protein [Streptomyces sp. NBC_00083]MCX5384284.1 hypothetical protein [Streptomyces sp. NBC_00083]